MPGDPPRRADGRCACGCGKRLPGVPKRHHRGIPDSAYTSEPFATTECCKRYHGVVFASYSESVGRGERKGRKTDPVIVS